MALTKIEETLPEEIKTIKNNLPKPIELDWNSEPVINLLDPEQFYEHYQELALTREEQKQCLKKINTRLSTPFELVYGRTTTLPVKIEVNTYPIKPIIEDNFQKTLLRKTYNLIETLENKSQRAVDNIQKSQEKQKEKHDNKLLDKPVEFKIGDKVLLYHIKAEKQ
ncbi:hypothetical protein G9A89_009935 [Geosiphon pyriformis]|nr:hypothetical protein G9A89_009935 [Geosiphon pyriformis]